MVWGYNNMASYYQVIEIKLTTFKKLQSYSSYTSQCINVLGRWKNICEECQIRKYILK